MKTKKNLFRRFLFISKFILLILLCFTFVQAAGEVDPGFISSAYGTINGNVYVITTQVDGKILIGGQFTDTNGHATSGIGRLNADGTVDTSFTPPDFYNGSGIGATVYAIKVQPDGKILVGGLIQGAGDTGPGIRRLNADGSLDSSFFVELFSPVTEIVTVYDIDLQSDGKIIIAGGFGFEFDINIRQLRRLNTNGTYDSSFAAPSLFNLWIKDIEVLPDNKIIAGGGSSQDTTSFLSKFNADGSVDSSFTPINGLGHIEAVKALPDGKFLVGGRFTALNGVPKGRISRINADGSVDVTFNPGGAGANNVVHDIAVRPDGKIVIGGDFASYNSGSRQRIAQLNADGTLDATFVNTTFAPSAVFVQDVELQADGKTLAGIRYQIHPDVNSTTRINTDGTLDSAFIAKSTFAGAFVGALRKILQQPDGKVLFGGAFPFVNGVQRKGFARVNSDGSLDTSFVPFFNTFTNFTPIILAMALQTDGKIIVGGSSTQNSFLISRLNPSGSADNTFSVTGLQGTVYDIVALANGQILAGGFFGGGGTFYILRFNSNGTIDATFAPFQPDGVVNKVLVQPDGKILIGGEFNNVAGAVRSKIARLNANGTLDSSFNPIGGAAGTVHDIDIQSDGKVVIGGEFTALNGNANVKGVGRLNADGSLDSSFIHSVNGITYAVKVQPDGKILIGGSMSAVDSIPKNGVARFNADGSLDSTFGARANTTVWDITLQTDGKILLAGAFTKINGISRVRTARLLNAAAPIRPLFDFDGDGKADVSVFRPSTNRWYVFKSSDSTVSETTFGIAGDVPVPADYDGDGKTDIAIFRPSSGDWWSLSSINGAQIFAHWGANGDVPRPSDFDGDGRADYVVFRPSDNFWYRISSANGATSNAGFGLAGDKAVTGDFDGDGKSDKAIYRPSTGDWWYQSSLNGAQLAVHWGISTDIPAPADFDGDGKTDFGVYRPSTGVWYIINSSSGSFLIMNFGIAEDKPVPADYDGDGKADIAVFRPSTGTWYQMRTTQGFFAQQFGVSTDIPTENAFIP